MKKMLTAGCTAVIIMLITGGCSTPPRHVTPGATPANITESHVSAARVKQFKAVTRTFPERGVGIYPEAFENRFSTEAVAGRIAALGFNRAYCCITTESALNDYFIELLRNLEKRDIPAEIVIFQRDYYRVYHSNRLLRPLLPTYPTLHDVAKKVIDFCNDLPEDVRKPAGLTIVVEPHFYTNANVERSHGKLYAWSENRYGIGQDNDMLMRDTYTQLKEIAQLPGLPPLKLAIHDFYHQNAAEGKLSIGTIADFQKLGQVMVINSGNVPTQLVKKVEDELKASGSKPILLVISLAGHVSENTGKLRRRDWNDFCRALDYAGQNFRKYPSFGGVVVAPLAVIEFLRQER